MDQQTQTELEAAAFRRLTAHLRDRTDVQNIDLMNLAGFCRNCLSNWYLDAANEKGLGLEKEDVREIVYGMPYSEWKDKYQSEASAEQVQAFKEVFRVPPEEMKNVVAAVITNNRCIGPVASLKPSPSALSPRPVSP